MKKYLLIALITLGICSSASAAVKAEQKTWIQGEPVRITLTGVKKVSEVKNVTFASTSVPVFIYDKKVIGFAPIDINAKPGTYEIVAELTNGRVMRRDIQVLARDKYQAPLGIPQKLGGNTAASQKQLVDTLAIENQTLLNLGSADKPLWKKAFTYPVNNPVVTDPYGYSRLTGAYTIAHKGTDFRAPEGTKVYAVNDGEVKLAQLGRNYGNTIIIDHGNEIKSMYMHLSELDVKVGDKVKRGQLIGLSGKTGYAEAAHLHFTLRINEISIDPEVFLGFFK